MNHKWQIYQSNEYWVIRCEYCIWGTGLTFMSEVHAQTFRDAQEQECAVLRKKALVMSLGKSL